MSMRAKPDMLDVESSDEEPQMSEDKKKELKAIAKAKYKAPKLVPMQFNENEEERKAKQIERARKRALQSSLIQDLKAQYSDAPLTITEKPKVSQLEREIRKFEENNYMSYQMTKKEKQLMRRRENQSTLDSLTKFGDYMAMDTVLEGKIGKHKKSRGVKRRGGPSKKKPKKSGGGKRRRR